MTVRALNLAPGQLFVTLEMLPAVRAPKLELAHKPSVCRFTHARHGPGARQALNTGAKPTQRGLKSCLPLDEADRIIEEIQSV